MRAALAALAAAALGPAAETVAPALTSVWGNGAVDVVRCGPGPDVVNADADDRVGSACEVVARRIATDSTTARGAQHATVAEPHLAARGRMLVTAYQVGRFVSGGAAAIGIAVSRDGGARWRASLLPHATGVTRVSDPVVAWDAAHATWLVTTVAKTAGGGSALLVSRSTDGTSWSAPAAIERRPTFRFDKEWVACDNGAASPHRGRCYVAYTHVPDQVVAVRSSDDGGATWREPVVAGPPADGQIGAIPVVRPDGSLLVLWLRARRGQVVARSLDGGATFYPPEQIAAVRSVRTPGVRAVEIPSATVGPDGTVSVAWSGCTTLACPRNGVVVTTSHDGLAWTAPRRVARVDGSVFAPAVAASPADGTLAAVFYALGPGGIDAWLARSTPAGDWAEPGRLSALTIVPAWAADSNLGAMLGDYVGLAFADDRPVAALPLAGPPRGGLLRQPLFATAPVP